MEKAYIQVGDNNVSKNGGKQQMNFTENIGMLLLFF